MATKIEKDEELSDMTEVLEERTKTGLPRFSKNKSGIFFIIIGIILLAIFLLPGLFKSDDEVVEDVPNKETEEVSVHSKDNFHFNNEEESKETQISTEGKEFSIPEKQPPILLGEPQEERVLTSPSIYKSSRNFMLKNGGNSGSSSKVGDITTDDASSNAISEAEQYLEEKSQSSSSEDDIFTAPTFKPTVATKGKLNPHLTLSQGTLIPCSLRGRLVSNISGQISCIVSDNVYSQSGSVLLIEKGSRVNGYYVGNSARHGSTEIFAVWQELKTPNNLIIPLMSGSTDELGANGLNGWADNHFWERFKNAILLSVIQDAMGVLAHQASKSDSYDYSERTRERSQDVAKTVLDQMGDIRPTIYKNQGDKVGIFVARDIDFSNVYELKRK